MINKKLTYRQDEEFNKWQESLRRKFFELLGPLDCDYPTEYTIEWIKEREGYCEQRFSIRLSLTETVPCHLLIPNAVKKPCPVIICLQGHSRGMHISLGQIKFPEDEKTIKGGRDFALQAVKQGYAAVTVEQEGMGERSIDAEYHPACLLPAGRALLYGRTLLGNRIRDISRTIDVLKNFPELDLDRLACMGNSGGGTAAFYAACADERIKVVMPSCSFCTYHSSIEAMEHCICNYIPRAGLYFDMGDLSALIAPRKMIVVAGNYDNIFPIAGVRKAYQKAEQIYEKQKVPNNISLVLGDAGHQFYPELGWVAFNQMTNWNNH